MGSSFILQDKRLLLAALKIAFLWKRRPCMPPARAEGGVAGLALPVWMLLHFGEGSYNDYFVPNSSAMVEQAAARTRVGSIDLLRGIVMVIMAIDHIRDYFYNGHPPLDMATTTPQLFFTRFITHYCAPTFLLLAGSSVYLMGLKNPPATMGAFLVKRGLWLILIECVVISLAITFDPFYHVIVLQVIWVTGIGMVVLGLLIWSKLPVGFIFLLGLCIVAGHNLLDYPEAARHQQVGFWWDLLHHGAFSKYTITGDHSILILYAIVPWMGIMLLGYCLGSWYRPSFDAKRRRSRLLWLGLSMTCLFVIIRLFNGYGDPHPWAMQRSPLISFLSFMNVTKYPPSLAYTCITLGPALVFLSLAEGIKNKITDFLTIFGRVPFFFYIIHFYVIHTLNVIIFFLSGYGIRDIGGPNTLIKFAPNQFSLSLGAVYVIWFFVILLMYPLCRRYNNYKNTNSHWWLRYL